MQKNINSVAENLSVCLSFDEAYERIRVQIEMECFPVNMIVQATEVAGIIAQVYTLPKNGVIKVAGFARRVSDVQSVFDKLQNEHVVYVIDAFNKIKKDVRFKTAYIRSALFNAVFELTSAENNRYAAAEAEAEND